MNSEQKDFEEIIEYLGGTLADDQRIEFERRALLDDALKKRLAEERFVATGLKILQCKGDIRKIHYKMLLIQEQNEKKTEAHNSKRRTSKWFAPTATSRRAFMTLGLAVMLTIGIGGYYYYYYQAIPGKPVAMGIEVANDNHVEKSQNIEPQLSSRTRGYERTETFSPEQFFREDEESQLLSERGDPLDFTMKETDRKALFDHYFSVDTIMQPLSDAEIKFNRAIMAMKNDHPLDAIALLGGVIDETRDSGLHQKAQWYVGLAYLLAGQMADTKKVFRVIRQRNGHHFQEQAKLLDQSLH